jgi:hypothetical protein
VNLEKRGRPDSSLDDVGSSRLSDPEQAHRYAKLLIRELKTSRQPPTRTPAVDNAQPPVPCSCLASDKPASGALTRSAQSPQHSTECDPRCSRLRAGRPLSSWARRAQYFVGYLPSYQGDTTRRQNHPRREANRLKGG